MVTSLGLTQKGMVKRYKCNFFHADIWILTAANPHDFDAAHRFFVCKKKIQDGASFFHMTVFQKALKWD